MASNPHKPGTSEWQQWLNDQIAQHDAEQAERDAKIDADLKKKAQEEAAKQAKKDKK